jgi:hypothetical protein
MRDRLGRLLGDIRLLQLATREEYQAEVFSRVNGVLALGNHMRPLILVTPEGPATVGDVSGNFAQLNQDAIDIASQLQRVETSAAQLYNLAAASQNALRQQIRESLYASNYRRFYEAFIHGRNLAESTLAVDFNAGVASLPLVEEVAVVPAIAVGTNSDGDVVVDPAALLDGKIETALVFNGTRLELILTFEKPEIINRLHFELDDYQGLEITTLTSSPDGSVFEDVLADLGVRTLLLNGTTGKCSGDVILDFPPRHAKQMRIIIEDRVDVARIALRSLTVLRRRYQALGTAVTQPISLAASPAYAFSTDERVFDPFTSITHQISTDGVHFTNIVPGDVVVTAPFWYKVLLQRNANAFDEQSSALINAGDLRQTDTYTLKRLSTVPVGAGIMERTIVLENITGPVRLRDVPLPATFRVLEGSLTLTSADYTFNGGVLSFPAPKTRTPVTVTYQTSALGAAALAARKEFYSPLLYEVRFEAL